MLTIEERKEKIRKLMSDLSVHFNASLWADSLKFYQMIKYRPSFFVEFWKQFDALDHALYQFSIGASDWPDDLARDLFCYVVLETSK